MHVVFIQLSDLLCQNKGRDMLIHVITCEADEITVIAELLGPRLSCPSALYPFILATSCTRFSILGFPC